MYITYNKSELFEKINKIDISRTGNQIVTKYDGRVISVSNVSKIYEIFDIKSYLKSKIDMIEANFKISKYSLLIKKGIQELRLISDEIEINGIKFYKTFFILNSSDKSRKLSFNLGIKSDESYIVFPSNLDLHKKHILGITKAAEKISEISPEIFSDQIEYISSLVGHIVSMENLKKVIVDDDSVKTNHTKFDSFKNSIIRLVYNKSIPLSKDQILKLYSPSNKNRDISNIEIDAFRAFLCYISLFKNQDSHLVKNETEKIMNITKYKIRNDALTSILDK